MRLCVLCIVVENNASLWHLRHNTHHIKGILTRRCAAPISYAQPKLRIVQPHYNLLCDIYPRNKVTIICQFVNKKNNYEFSNKTIIAVNGMDESLQYKTESK